MTKFQVGDEVYVPSRLLPRPDLQNFALTRARVLGQTDRSVRIDRQDQNGNDLNVASRLLHGKNLGVTIFRIGDLLTEEHTIDPLGKSVLHYLRLLLEPDAVRLRSVRTAAEIEKSWETLEAVTSHVVLIGHGSQDSIRLMDREHPVGGRDFGLLLEGASATTAPKTFVSLSCLTGRKPFAKPLSEATVCSDLLAPFQSIHAAAGSLFTQSFFSHHLLNGEGVLSAFHAARQSVGSGVTYRHWRKGALTSSRN